MPTILCTLIEHYRNCVARAAICNPARQTDSRTNTTAYNFEAATRTHALVIQALATCSSTSPDACTAPVSYLSDSYIPAPSCSAQGIPHTFMIAQSTSGNKQKPRVPIAELEPGSLPAQLMPQQLHRCCKCGGMETTCTGWWRC